MDEIAIRRYASRLRIGVIAAFALILVPIVCGRLGLRPAGTHVFVQSRAEQGIGPLQVSDGTLLLLGIALFELTEALRSVASGGLFSAEVVRRFSLFALWLLIMALFSYLAPVLAHLLVGRTGEHHVLIVLDIPNLLLIAITLLLFLLARLLERARIIEDEMREIV